MERSLGRAKRGKSKPKSTRQPLERIVVCDTELRRVGDSTTYFFLPLLMPTLVPKITRVVRTAIGHDEKFPSLTVPTIMTHKRQIPALPAIKSASSPPQESKENLNKIVGHMKETKMYSGQQAWKEKTVVEKAMEENGVRYVRPGTLLRERMSAQLKKEDRKGDKQIHKQEEIEPESSSEDASGVIGEEKEKQKETKKKPQPAKAKAKQLTEPPRKRGRPKKVVKEDGKEQKLASPVAAKAQPKVRKKETQEQKEMTPAPPKKIKEKVKKQVKQRKTEKDSANEAVHDLDDEADSADVSGAIEDESEESEEKQKHKPEQRNTKQEVAKARKKVEKKANNNLQITKASSPRHEGGPQAPSLAALDALGSLRLPPKQDIRQKPTSRSALDALPNLKKEPVPKPTPEPDIESIAKKHPQPQQSVSIRQRQELSSSVNASVLLSQRSPKRPSPEQTQSSKLCDDRPTPQPPGQLQSRDSLLSPSPKSLLNQNTYRPTEQDRAQTYGTFTDRRQAQPLHDAHYQSDDRDRSNSISTFGVARKKYEDRYPKESERVIDKKVAESEYKERDREDSDSYDRDRSKARYEYKRDRDRYNDRDRSRDRHSRNRYDYRDTSKGRHDRDRYDDRRKGGTRYDDKWRPATVCDRYETGSTRDSERDTRDREKRGWEREDERDRDWRGSQRRRDDRGRDQEWEREEREREKEGTRDRDRVNVREHGREGDRSISYFSSFESGDEYDPVLGSSGPSRERARDLKRNREETHENRETKRMREEPSYGKWDHKPQGQPGRIDRDRWMQIPTEPTPFFSATPAHSTYSIDTNTQVDGYFQSQALYATQEQSVQSAIPQLVTLAPTPYSLNFGTVPTAPDFTHPQQQPYSTNPLYAAYTMPTSAPGQANSGTWDYQ